MDFRVRLKQKGGVWPANTVASFYLSKDTLFDSNDKFLGEKDRDLTNETEKYKTIKLEDVDMADYIKKPGKWYVFVSVSHEMGENNSTYQDEDERFKIIVEDNSKPWEWKNLTPAQQAAVLQIITEPLKKKEITK